MTNALRPYPEYEPGPTWIGPVPSHWKCLPNRAIFREIKDQGHSDEPMLSVTITRGVIRQADLLADTSKKDSSNLDRSKYKLVQPGDIAYNKMRAWQGAAGASRHRGIVSPAYVVQRLRGDDNPEYFHHLFRTPTFAKEAERWSYGITSDMWSLRPEHFKAIYTPLPPPAEQSGIVRFLGALDQKVNRFIRAKQYLIQRLREYRANLIDSLFDRAVLAESAPVLPLKRCVARGSSISYGIVQPGEHVPEGVPFVQTGNLTNLAFRPEDLQRTTVEIAAKFPRSVLSPGDVLLGIRASVGMAAVAPESLAGANLSRGIARIVVGPSLLPEYLVLYLSTLRVQRFWQQFQQGTTFNEIPISLVRILAVPVLSRQRQERLIQEVAARVVSLDAAISGALQEIDLIREFRTRLVADVVTGKIDVQAAAASLPETELGAADSSSESDDGEDQEDDIETDAIEEAADVAQ